MGLKKKSKRLEWWIAEFGETRGPRLFLEQLAHKRKRNIEILKTVSGLAFLLKLIGK